MEDRTKDFLSSISEMLRSYLENIHFEGWISLLENSALNTKDLNIAATGAVLATIPTSSTLVPFKLLTNRSWRSLYEALEMPAILRLLCYQALFWAVDPDFSSSSYRRLVNSSIIDGERSNFSSVSMNNKELIQRFFELQEERVKVYQVFDRWKKHRSMMHTHTTSPSINYMHVHSALNVTQIGVKAKGKRNGHLKPIHACQCFGIWCNITCLLLVINYMYILSLFFFSFVFVFFS